MESFIVVLDILQGLYLNELWHVFWDKRFEKFIFLRMVLEFYFRSFWNFQIVYGILKGVLQGSFETEEQGGGDVPREETQEYEVNLTMAIESGCFIFFIFVWIFILILQ